MRREIELPESLEHLEEGDFESVLCDELEADSGELPLDRYTNQAGWPDPDTVEIEVQSVSYRGTKKIVTIHIKFAEVIPTGCADIKRNGNCFGLLDLVFDPEEGVVYYEWDKDEG